MQHHEIERKRLNERIRTITGTAIAAELRQYRYQINLRSNILERGARAVVIPPKDGRASRGNRSYRAHDELELLHRFLDERDVAGCHWHVHA